MLDLLTLVRNMRALKVIIKNSMFSPEIYALLQNTKPYYINLEHEESSAESSESVFEPDLD